MTWTVDPLHSSVEFSVKHMAISKVRGRFKEVAATADLSDDGVPRNITATMSAASIDTGVKDRDDHLRSPDFFDVEQYPTITFRSTSVSPKGDGEFAVQGDLTMRGVTKPVTLELEVTEPIKDPYGNRRLAAELEGTLNRKDWDLSWNQVLEMGGLMVSEEVKLEITVQAVSEAKETAAVA